MHSKRPLSNTRTELTLYYHAFAAMGTPPVATAVTAINGQALTVRSSLLYT